MPIRSCIIPLLALLIASPAFGQLTSKNLSLTGLLPAGPRTTVTDSWGTLRVELTNRGDTPRDVRVAVFYPHDPNVHYGRDLWLPPDSVLNSWLTVGKAPSGDPSMQARELKYQLFDKSSGTSWVVLPNEDDRLRSRAVPYRKREATTSVLTDSLAGDAVDPDAFEVTEAAVSPVFTFVRVFRQTIGISESVSSIQDRFLPATADSFEGIDHFVLAGNRLRNDPIALQTLRNWIQRGGVCWVMLDRVDMDSVVPLLGDDCRFSVIDRTSVNTVRLLRHGDDAIRTETHEHEDPVPMVRVRLGGTETVYYTTDGWPAAFGQAMGRGKIVFTTLDGRAWYRPRQPRERRSPFENHPNLPVAIDAMERLAGDFVPFETLESMVPTNLNQLNAAEIGYSVVSQSSAATFFVLFLLLIAGLGIGLRQTRRPERIVWIGPVFALAFAGIFAAFGLQSRHSTPETVAVAAIADIQPGTRSGALSGIVASYRPDSGVNTLTMPAGSLFIPDAGGLDGQTRKLIQTDADTRIWDQLSLPAGVRMGPYRSPLETGVVTAEGRFGSDGLTGRLALERFPAISDVVFISNETSAYGVTLSATGEFTVRAEDRLKPGQFVAGTVVSDRQQRRQEVLRRYLTPYPKHLAGRPHLFAWADSPGETMTASGKERTVGNVLLIIPLTLLRPAPETSVVVPQGFIGIRPEGQGRLLMESSMAGEQTVRFRLPPSLLPLNVEKATLHLTVRARGRTVTVSGLANGKPVPLFDAVNPMDPIRLDITNRDLLQHDADGYLRVKIKFGERASATGDFRDPEQYADWSIDSLGLDVTGRTRPRRTE